MSKSSKWVTKPPLSRRPVVRLILPSKYPPWTFSAITLTYAFFIIIFTHQTMPSGLVSGPWIIHKAVLIGPSGAIMRTPPWLAALYSNPCRPVHWSIQYTTRTHTPAGKCSSSLKPGVPVVGLALRWFPLAVLWAMLRSYFTFVILTMWWSLIEECQLRWRERFRCLV